MPREIDEEQVQALLDAGHSQRTIAKELNIPRSTVGVVVRKLKIAKVYREGAPEKGVPEASPATQPHGTPELQELLDSLDDLKEVLVWWKERQRAPSIARDADQETQRQTYHVQKRYIEAVKRAADLERVSIAEIVNRAFAAYFNKE